MPTQPTNLINKIKTKIEFKATGKEILNEGVPGIYIEGWASVREPADRYGDTISTDAFDNSSIETYFGLNPILLYEHGMDTTIGNKPLGQAVSYQDLPYGLWVKFWIPRPSWSPMLEVYNKIRQGILKTFSIGGIWFRGSGGSQSSNSNSSEITGADLMEISVVATPAQPYAVFDLAKKFEGMATKSTRQSAKLAILPLAIASLDYWTAQAITSQKSHMSNRHKLILALRIAQSAKEVKELSKTR